eukprot:TRINITY_DN1471_c4_g1_i1.p1 TRINITY_DN1471_c4_g1~~TRINITY_DN1471_c4_g1_i1.p1  ORF type:complete len:1169 (+),score=191.64 TRINITY_DN1471_c4_g1_i1:177-3683(+)
MTSKKEPEHVSLVQGNDEEAAEICFMGSKQAAEENEFATKNKKCDELMWHDLDIDAADAHRTQNRSTRDKKKQKEETINEQKDVGLEFAATLPAKQGFQFSLSKKSKPQPVQEVDEVDDISQFFLKSGRSRSRNLRRKKSKEVPDSSSDSDSNSTHNNNDSDSDSFAFANPEINNSHDEFDIIATLPTEEEEFQLRANHEEVEQDEVMRSFLNPSEENEGNPGNRMQDEDGDEPPHPDTDRIKKKSKHSDGIEPGKKLLKVEDPVDGGNEEVTCIEVDDVNDVNKQQQHPSEPEDIFNVLDQGDIDNLYEQPRLSHSESSSDEGNLMCEPKAVSRSSSSSSEPPSPPPKRNHERRRKEPISTAVTNLRYLLQTRVRPRFTAKERGAAAREDEEEELIEDSLFEPQKKSNKALSKSQKFKSKVSNFEEIQTCVCFGKPPLCAICRHVQHELDKQLRLKSDYGGTNEGYEITDWFGFERAKRYVDESETRKEYIEVSESMEQDEESVWLNESPSNNEIDILHKKDKAPSVKIPKKIEQILRPHQVEGIRFLWKNIAVRKRRSKSANPPLGCILAHSMGLGKTAQILIFIQLMFLMGQASRVLILTPKSTISNWASECERWRMDGATHNVFVMDGQREEVLSELSDYHDDPTNAIVVMGYGRYSSLIVRDEREFVRESLRDPGPDLLILDEGHVLKSQVTNISQLLSEVKTQRRVIITGTPLQNSMQEYYSMINFIIPGYFNRKGFVKFFQGPIVSGQRHDSTESEVATMKQRSYILSCELRHVVHRKDQTILLHDLPPKQEFVIMLPLSALQLLVYSSFFSTHRESFSTDGERQFFFFTSVMAKLCSHLDILRSFILKRQDELGGKAWTQPLLDPNYVLQDPKTSVKLTALLIMLRYAVEHNEKVLVFSQSTATISFFTPYIEELFNGRGRVFKLTGKSTSEERRSNIDTFQKVTGRPAVFLISTNAGGVGINLNTAHKAILVDVSYNPAQDQQAIFRCYRYGQVNPVNIYRFCSDGTPESAIFNVSVAKEWIQKKIVNNDIPSRNNVRYTNLRNRVFTDLQKGMHKELEQYADRFEAESKRCLDSDPALRYLMETLKEQGIPPTRIFRNESLFVDDTSLEVGEDERRAYEEFKKQGPTGDFIKTMPASSGVAKGWEEDILNMASELNAM